MNTVQQIIRITQYSLPQAIQTIVDSLNSEFSDKTDIPPPVSMQRVGSSFGRKNGTMGGGRNHKKNKLKSPKISSENLESMMNDWEAVRNFKVTAKTQSEGVDKVICDIRVLLNKLTCANYNEKKEELVEYLSNVCESTPEYTQTVTDRIFIMMSSNKFLSNVYAQLYEEFICVNKSFADKLSGYIDSFITSFDNVKYVDPDVDYNGFCKYNKENELILANAAFISNLMIRGMIPRDDVIDLILLLQTRNNGYIDEPDKKTDIENISECIFVLVKECKETLKDELKWNVVEENIKSFAGLKAKEHASLSSRAVFKHMDML